MKILASILIFFSCLIANQTSQKIDMHGGKSQTYGGFKNQNFKETNSTKDRIWQKTLMEHN
ncbi:hypothetical protein [Campylobacter mucosalis]|uniref:hypothetical protein n=1 Tax=Campylobacter mucosalis TaxID=202 RepID=UPI0004D9548F|nr:hypothetical protein [Campylobacter mucosalis]KEA46232.1 hypothetical protein CR66_03290 [Campylobacter mucosalis]